MDPGAWAGRTESCSSTPRSTCSTAGVSGSGRAITRGKPCFPTTPPRSPASGSNWERTVSTSSISMAQKPGNRSTGPLSARSSKPPACRCSSGAASAPTPTSPRSSTGACAGQFSVLARYNPRNGFAPPRPATPNRIVLGVDAKNGFVATEGWLEVSKVKAVDLARQVSDSPLAAVVYTDIAKDGMMSGPNFEALAEMQAAIPLPVIASGGVCTLDHVRRLITEGIPGCIIGRALYEGSLDLAAALALTRRAETRQATPLTRSRDRSTSRAHAGRAASPPGPRRLHVPRALSSPIRRVTSWP